MENVGVSLLIIFIILLCLSIASILTLVSISTFSTGGESNNINNLPSCSANIQYGSLYQITNNTPVCCSNGKLTANYYIGCNSQYDYVVGTNPVDPHDVCVQYCSSPVGECTGTTPNGNSAKENYDNCMAQLSGNNCIPPMPIAAKGNVLYYANKVTPNSCTAGNSDQCFSDCNFI